MNKSILGDKKMKKENLTKQKHNIGRREFVKGTAATVAAFSVVPSHVLGGPGKTPPSDKLNIAAVGIGGKGQENTQVVAQTENVVALCDVDQALCADIFKSYPKAKKYSDYRKMLEKNKDIDAVIIATPDHSHAVIAIAAMELGKHVYVQKPMTHSIYECRRLKEAAARYKVVTQMGNQGHSNEGCRLTKEWIADGAIGAVREVYCWTNRPIWPQGIRRPSEAPKVPDTLDWDLWIGPAKMRPYNPAYHPFKWRGWWDFGTGAFGDMGCHVLDTPYFALGLDNPESLNASFVIESDYEKTMKHTYPKASIVHYKFGKKANRPAVKLHWYDGGLLPPRPEGFEDARQLPNNGVLYIGDKGLLLSPDEYGGSPRLVPETKMRSYKLPAKTIPRITVSHEQNWVQACKGQAAAVSRFDYATGLTEMVLLGNLAIKARGELVKWDKENMTVTNHPELNQYVKEQYRQGWSL